MKYTPLLQGVNRYGKKWPEIRQKVLKRDGYRCKICGSTHHLHVHHLIPWKISRSNEDLNLVVLCRKCHPKVEKFTWKLLQEGAHRFQIYKAAWEFIKKQKQLLLEKKNES